MCVCVCVCVCVCARPPREGYFSSSYLTSNKLTWKVRASCKKLFLLVATSTAFLHLALTSTAEDCTSCRYTVLDLLRSWDQEINLWTLLKYNWRGEKHRNSDPPLTLHIHIQYIPYVCTECVVWYGSVSIFNREGLQSKRLLPLDV